MQFRATMSAISEASTSLSSDNSEDSKNEIMTEEQLQCVSMLRNWVENQAKFNGRTNDEFLLPFVFGCKFDLKKAKKKMYKYYELKKNIPEWWTERDVTNSEINDLLNLKISTILKEVNDNHPTVIVSTAARIGQHVTNFASYMKYSCITVDMTLHRRNSRRNKVIWINNAKDHPLWLYAQLLSPKAAKNCIQSVYLSIPIRIQTVIVIHTNPILLNIYKLIKPFLSKKIRERIHFLDSDLSKLHELVPLELLPEEYGGSAGSMKDHDEAFLREIKAREDYFVEDDQYGFTK